MRRSAAVATVRAPSTPIRVYGVHFETTFGASSRAQRDQARTVAVEAAAWTGPVVIAGDFNGTAAARELASLGYEWLTRDVHNTSGALDADHVLVRGLCATSRPAAAKAQDPTRASDHVPVWTMVRICTLPN
jgi:endonuclease/exonuclease/phosphatase family metal-dependent hydrolase